ncbi:MAG: sugar ABC transporter permease [Clostridia bacterium]
MSNSKMARKSIPYVLIFPALILIFVFKIYPIVRTLLESLMINGTVTTQIYESVFHDPTFWNSLWITIKLNLVMIPVQILVSFCLAMISNVTLKGIGVFRTIYFLPFTISLTVATIIWSLMFNTNSGIINSLLSIFGVRSQRFLVDKNQALWCIVVIASWKGCGYWMMFFLAGLKNIDQAIYESAKIDGAGFLTTVSRITIPLIRRVTLFVLVANTTANVLLFVPMQMLTQGGPQGSTNVLMYEAYNSAFKFADRPRSSAIVMVLLVIIVLICAFQFRLLEDKREGSGIKA